MASDFAATFLKDAFGLLESLRYTSSNLEKEGSLPEIARALHSLKSGAAFLGWEELEQAAGRGLDRGAHGAAGFVGAGTAAIHPVDHPVQSIQARIDQRAIAVIVFATSLRFL